MYGAVRSGGCASNWLVINTFVFNKGKVHLVYCTQVYSKWSNMIPMLVQLRRVGTIQLFKGVPQYPPLLCMGLHAYSFKLLVAI